jgi:hypothetical protein
LSQHTRHLRGARTLLLAVALVGALLGVLIASQHASASATNYCSGWEPPYGGSCVGPSHNLTANIVYDDTGSGSWVCEVVLDGNGWGYGYWSCGSGETETCYGGGRALRGLIENASPYWLYMNGTEFYNTGCP